MGDWEARQGLLGGWGDPDIRGRDPQWDTEGLGSPTRGHWGAGGTQISGDGKPRGILGGWEPHHGLLGAWGDPDIQRRDPPWDTGGLGTPTWVTGGLGGPRHPGKGTPHGILGGCDPTMGYWGAGGIQRSGEGTPPWDIGGL